MVRENGTESKRLAKELYCLDFLGIAQSAALAGVSETSVRSWIKKEGWQAEREEIAATEAEIRRNLLQARALALSKLLHWEGDKESALALSAVEKLEKLALAMAKQRIEKARTAAVAKAGEKTRCACPPLDLKLPEGIPAKERIAMLEDGINRQIAYLLRQPVENLSEHVRGVKAAMDVLASLRGRDERPSIQVSFDD